MKAKKKFPDLNKDGKITQADILKGRGVFEGGGVVEFRSKDRETAKKMLREYFQKKGGRSYLKNAQQPSMSKDTNTGEFIARPQSFAGGGKVETYKKGGKVKKKKKKKGGGMAGLSAAQKEVYRRGLAAYMSSGNRPKVSQHAWAMARVKSAFGKREAAKIRAKKSKKK